MENIDYESSDYSRNHMFFGDIVRWYYKELTGIMPDPNSVGFKHFFIQPFFPGTLEFAEATHDCLYGQIRSEWKRAGEDIALVIEIPANTSSTIILPKSDLQINNTPVKKSDSVKNLQTGSKTQQFELGSGVYKLVLKN